MSAFAAGAWLAAVIAQHRPDDWDRLPVVAMIAMGSSWLWHSFRIATTKRTCCAACDSELESEE